MDDRPSRSEIIQRIETAHDRLAMTLVPFTPNQMLESGVVSYWSVKDVLAHLITWNVLSVFEIDAAVKGQPYEYPEETRDQINARAVEQHRGFNLMFVCAEFEASYTMLWETVQKLSDEAFQPGGRIEQALGDTINGALAKNTYEHWLIHEAQIRQWIEQRH